MWLFPFILLQNQNGKRSLRQLQGLYYSFPLSLSLSLILFFLFFASGLTELVGALLGYLVLMEVFNQIVFGILFGLCPFILFPPLPPFYFPLILPSGLVSGMMVYVSIAELLPQARKVDPVCFLCGWGMCSLGVELIFFFFFLSFFQNDKWTSVMCFVGMFVMALSLVVFDLTGAVG